MSQYQKFRQSRAAAIEQMGKDEALKTQANNFIRDSSQYGYSYNFEWLGRPIIQFPQDILALQELFWAVKPELIVETGIAHGGSLIMSASMLALLDLCESTGQDDPHGAGGDRKVVGVDVDIREHNREAIEAHPLAKRIHMIEGSSVAPDVIAQVREIASDYERIFVILDSNHTHEHVLAELELYAPLTSIGSYCVVLDTIIDSMPASMFPDRPWGPGDNPKTAVRQYLESHSEFEIDDAFQKKLLISVAPDGFLKRVAP